MNISIFREMKCTRKIIALGGIAPKPRPFTQDLAQSITPIWLIFL